MNRASSAEAMDEDAAHVDEEVDDSDGKDGVGARPGQLVD
jgi:hypothetical protein